MGMVFSGARNERSADVVGDGVGVDRAELLVRQTRRELREIATNRTKQSGTGTA